jgi:hypothetical protein
MSKIACYITMEILFWARIWVAIPLRPSPMKWFRHKQNVSIQLVIGTETATNHQFREAGRAVFGMAIFLPRVMLFAPFLLRNKETRTCLARTNCKTTAYITSSYSTTSRHTGWSAKLERPANGKIFRSLWKTLLNLWIKETLISNLAPVFSCRKTAAIERQQTYTMPEHLAF